MELLARQQKLLDDLTRYDPKIAKCYLGALKVLEQNNPDKIAQSAHSIREVIEQLARIPDREDIPKQYEKTDKEGPREKRDTRKNRLRRLDPLDSISHIEHYTTDDLVGDEFLDWFQKVSHHGMHPTERKYRQKLRKTESLLALVVKPHLEVIHDIDEILSKKPTENNFKENLKPLLERNLSTYNHFFQHASSSWLPFLADEKYFNSPRHIIQGSEEIQFPIWWPGRYLARVSHEQPELVAKIIKDITLPQEKKERNPWILEDFVRAAIAMPTKYSRQLVSKITKEKWADIPYDTALGSDMAKMMIKLADDGCEEESIELCKMLLHVTLSEPTHRENIIKGNTTERDVEPVLDDFTYTKILEDIPHLYDQFPVHVICLLIKLLEKTVKLDNRGRNQKRSQDDMSVAWRPSIEDHEQNLVPDFKSQLIGTLGSILILEGRRSMSDLKEVVSLLGKEKYPIFKRLALYIYQNYPLHFKREIRNAIIQDFDNPHLIHEYFHLLKKNCPTMSSSVIRKYLALVEDGPKQESLDLWKENARFADEIYVKLQIKKWKVEKLEPVFECLKDKQRHRFDDLINDVGRVTTPPDFHFVSFGTRTSEPTTNLTDGLDVERVISFIKSNVPEQDGFGYHDGTGSKFQKYVTNNPFEFSKRSTDLQNTNPVYVVNFLRGLENAIIEEQTGMMEWKQILSLCKHVIESADKKNPPTSRECNMIYYIACVLKAGLMKNSTGFDSREDIWMLLESLATFEDKSSQDEEYPDKNFNSHTLSINTLAGQTLHAIINYAIWCNTHLENKRNVLVPEAKNLLSRYFADEIPNSVSGHAVLGLYLPSMILLDKKWIMKNFPRMFGHKQERLNRAAWDAYLLNRKFRHVFAHICDNYRTHIRTFENIQLKTDGHLQESDTCLIRHVTESYLYGMKGGQKLFFEMLHFENEHVLSYCVKHIGRILRGEKKNPSQSFNIRAMRRIWRNSKLSTNESVSLWLESTPFTEDETIKLFLNSLQKSNTNLKYPYRLIDSLRQYAKSHPLQIVECLELMVHKDVKNHDDQYMRTRKFGKILKILLASHNDNVVRRAMSLINYLGALGYNEYKDLLT